MNKYDVRIGSILRKYRLQRKMSMQEVADRLNVTKTAVHYWETGKRSMYAVQLIDYCNVIGLDPQELVKEVFGIEG